jgi:CRP/FNR family transcriptional regulator
MTFCIVPHDVEAGVQASACAQCMALPRCLSEGLSSKELGRFQEIVCRRRLKKREYLCLGGNRFHSLYAVRSGSLKSSALRPDGFEQVLGFHMPGDLVGIDGLGNGEHPCDIVAMEDSELCAMPFQSLERLAREMPALDRMMNAIMSRQIVRHYSVMMMLAKMHADERVAAFLLMLSRRRAARGHSAQDLELPMTRDDMGSYLGLKVETVSRTLARLQRRGLIRVCMREIRLLDMEAIRLKVAPYFSGNRFPLTSLSGAH